MTETSMNLEPIIKEGVRIFRPREYELLTKAIPKIENKTKFDFLLFTGLRYKEGKVLFSNPKLFNGTSIKIKSGKAKAKVKERWVKLNKDGVIATRYFLRDEKGLPAYSTWVEDLERWCKYAGIDDEGMSVKTTRKTWESWLILTHPEKTFDICLSQGHDELTSLRHYTNLPFNKEEKEHIKIYTKGWGEE